ncbi:hypothetical protein ACIBUY_34160 [Streptomyces sp. NPDC050085]|uniref:hypothetical protein n=1 Tax=Streptomyces sp. NPDC050085 TaxID=3365600 RepID=UPI00379B48C1
MSETELNPHNPPVPVRLDADRWASRTIRKRILAVVHTVTSGQRLMEAVRLLEGDARVQVCFTAAPDVFGHGVDAFLEGIDGLVLPWDRAVQTPFDLALAAAYGGLHELHAPVVVLPHGAGHNKVVSRARPGHLRANPAAYGLNRQTLLHDGAVVPRAIVLAHHDELTRLGRECPEALPAAEVVGDPVCDRVAASLSCRALYRKALGARPGQQLVLVTSTWGPHSLVAHDWDLLARLLTELPREEYRVALTLHPNVWNAHGSWQIRSWLAGLARAGLVLVDQHAQWEGALVAADHIVGDHGSVTLYGVLTGAPVLFAGAADAVLDPASPLAELRAVAPGLRAGRPLRAQLRRATVTYDRQAHERVAARLTSHPGAFAARMRTLMYRTLRLRAQSGTPAPEPASLPRTVAYGEPGSVLS